MSDKLHIRFADNGNIRKWSREHFEGSTEYISATTWQTLSTCPENTQVPCKYGDPSCPCQDGDPCHYEGENPMNPALGGAE